MMFNGDAGLSYMNPVLTLQRPRLSYWTISPFSLTFEESFIISLQQICSRK